MDLSGCRPSLFLTQRPVSACSGDSYSDVGYDYTKESSIPTDEIPLGIEFPGVTWADHVQVCSHFGGVDALCGMVVDAGE